MKPIKRYTPIGVLPAMEIVNYGEYVELKDVLEVIDERIGKLKAEQKEIEEQMKTDNSFKNASLIGDRQVLIDELVKLKTKINGK